MALKFSCDAIGCGSVGDARVTALSIDDGGEPVIYLPPIGWTNVVMRDGRRLQACGKSCIDALTGADSREPTGVRAPSWCPHCSQRMT